MSRRFAVLRFIVCGTLFSLCALPLRAASPVDVLRTSNDRIHRFTMENGAIGVIKPDTSAPVVAIQLWFGTGSIHEDEYMGAGLSHYVEHMIFKGTPTRTTGDITRELDSAGGRVNAYTTLDRTVFHVVMPSVNWRVGLDVLSDAVKNAAFPEDEWQSEQQVILQEMAMNRDDPARELSRLLWSTAFREHPYRHPVIGYPEVFLQTTREDLIAFFQQHYRPDNMIVAIAGDVQPHEVEQEVRHAFRDFERSMRRPVIIPTEPPQMAPRVARKTGAYEISRAAWGFHTVPLHHADAAALAVLADIIGGGESSRLRVAIRDRLQRVHDIRAWSYTAGYPGFFGIHATFDPTQEQAVLEAVETELRQWQDEPFTAAEVDAARRRVLVGQLSELATMRGQVHDIASGEFFAGTPRFSEQRIERIAHVTPAAVYDVMQRYLRPENQTLALLTPASIVAEKDETIPPPLIGEPQLFELSNGLTVIIREDHRLPLVDVSVVLLGGLLSESDEDRGVSQYMANLLGRGTRQRTALEIARRLDALGAEMSPFSGVNSFGLQGDSLTENLDELLEIMAESLLAPSFPDDEIERQRTRQLAAIRAARENPMQVADQLVRDTLYPGHAYQWTPNGREDTVQELQREQLVAFLRRHLVTGNLAIAVFGAVNADEVVPRIEQVFAHVPVGPRMSFDTALPERTLPARIERREPREQTIFLMAFPGVDLHDDRVPALEIIQTALSGLSSHLGMEVREKRGLVYFVGAFQRVALAPGRFVLYAGTYEEAVPEMQELMEAELHRLATTGLTDEELHRAKAQLTGDFYARLQDNATLAQHSALDTLFGLGYRHGFERAARLELVTHDDIRHAAQAILDQTQRVIAVVLPRNDHPDGADEN